MKHILVVGLGVICVCGTESAHIRIEGHTVKEAPRGARKAFVTSEL